MLMLCNAVYNYIATAKGLPFFYVVGDDKYSATLDELSQLGLIIDRASDFCPKEDKLPNVDDIIDHFRTLDVDYKQNKHVLVGLGEFLALRGASVAEKELHRLKNATLGSARVVVLLRCVTTQVFDLANEDRRLAQQGRVYVDDNPLSSIGLTCIKYAVDDSVVNGVKGFLRLCEDGATGTIGVNTAMLFPNAMLPVSSINSAYAAIRKTLPDFTADEGFGTEQQWDQLFKELVKAKWSLAYLFGKCGFSIESNDDLYRNCAGYEFKNWLFFLFLKLNVEDIGIGYLRFAVQMTDNYEHLKDNILTAIIQVPRNDSRFHVFYNERKKLIRYFPESEIAIFVHRNSINHAESLYRYTDNTRMEREEIIRWLSVYGYRSEIEYVYPALYDYFKDYTFDCGKLSEALTSYFREYKLQKLTNTIHPEFQERVNAYALSLPYVHLETRDSAILRIEDKKSAFLYWIDALGVEYLSYITELVKKKGLSIHIDVAYAELPTITSINRGFYEKWPGELKEKLSDLDDVKHKEKGGYVFDAKHEAPIHLAAELEIIERAVDRAATELAMHRCKSFVIASDHGASRLAVIRKQEEKYETDTKGEHSGRCCKEFPDADLPFAVKENGYYVLADYGRFKKSRAANVEVHGGASLEEVLVPVITLTLRKQTSLVVQLADKDVRADRKTGTTFVLFISEVEHPYNISVIIDGERYQAKHLDATHYEVNMPSQKRSKKDVRADVYDGDDLVGNITFEIKGKFGGADKKEFDDLTL